MMSVLWYTYEPPITILDVMPHLKMVLFLTHKRVINNRKVETFVCFHLESNIVAAK